MISKNGNRMLAYVQKIKDIEPLYLCKKDENGTFIPDLDKDGNKQYADSIEKAHILGWTIITKKGEFKPGDKCVFFEIDSKVPAARFLDKDGQDVFNFLMKKKYCIQTYKLNKFGIWSQGLALPLSSFGLSDDLPLNEDLTEKLGVVYAVSEDRSRKKSSFDLAANQLKLKHPKFFKNKLVVKLMRYKFFRDLCFLPTKKETKMKAFPSAFVNHTDEERIQNMPWMLENKEPFIATEKIDGTSTTWLLVRKPFGKFEFYVCSRNIRIPRKIAETTENVYWENALKYDAENQLKSYLKKHKELKWVCIQGESYGEDLQGNPLKMKGHHFAAFNFIDSKKGRWGSIEAKEELSKWEKPIPWVPILNTDFILPDTVEELLKIATAKSIVNKDVLREGIVFRSKDGKTSFKAVSPEYLERHNL